MMQRQGFTFAIWLLIGLLVFHVALFGGYIETTRTASEDRGGISGSVDSRVLSGNNDQITRVKKYTTDDIILTSGYIKKAQPLLFVWDGHEFSAYSVVHKGEPIPFGWRNAVVPPLMVYTLRTHFSERFQPGSPPFTVLWSTFDYIASKCVNSDSNCPSTSFAPILQFGSVPRDKSLMPTVKAFPNIIYCQCLHRMLMKGQTSCAWESVNQQLEWNQLEPTLFWRGSDFSNYLLEYKPFYRKPLVIDSLFPDAAMKGMTQTEVVDKLFEHYVSIPPRWNAVAYTLRTQLANESNPWIDVKFSNKGIFNKELHERFNQKGLQVTADPVDSYNMSKYKYQIDLGGGGGTTWLGTITKLLMPGVLFHHETPFEDWFYDLMEPYVHYIPVIWDLSNLYQQSRWAIGHPVETQAISKRATDLGAHLLSESYMRHMFQELFVDYIGQVVEAFDPVGTEWKDMVQKYEKHGDISLHKVSTCDDYNCHTHVEEGNVMSSSAHVPLKSQ